MSHLDKIAAAAMLSLAGCLTATAATDYTDRLEAGEITPLGAKRAGNAAGTIPAWECDVDGTAPGIDVAPADVDSHRYPAIANPFADEEPRFTITAANHREYADKLTPGTRKLFEQYPDAFAMPVYPTHRTACFSETLYRQAALNAEQAELVDGGGGVANAFMAPPFPLPENGLQAVWNNMLSANPWREYAHYTGLAVYVGGSRSLEETEYEIFSYYNDPRMDREEYLAGDADGKHLQAGFMLRTVKPERSQGTINMGRDYLRKTEFRRESWQYLPGTRRVRRYPYFGYDTPQGAGGLRGVDEDRLFNGAPDRFDWKLRGTKEILVPYNAYVMDSDVSYDELLGDRVVNPDYTRWELHRVRVVEGTLKDGARHWYSKRVLYLDEDTGFALLADNYDHHGNLWRTSQQNYVRTPVLEDAMLGRVAVFYDFEAGAYTAQRLINENQVGQNPRLNFERLPEEYFTPGNLRDLGHR